MKCISKTELEQFLRGELEPGRLIAVDEHLSACGECRAALAAAPTARNAACELGALVLEVADCPEYEELSALIDGTLDASRARAVTAHMNACETCSRDVARIKELRSYSALREEVTVRPGASRNNLRSPLVYLKQVLAGAAAVAAVAAIVLTFDNSAKVPENKPVVAINRGTTHEAKPEATPNTPPAPNDVIIPPKPPITQPPRPTPPEIVTQPDPKPTHVAVLRDGGYGVIRKNGKLVFATADGKPHTAMKARIAASIDEKLKNGRVRPARPVQLAMASIALRASDSYVPPPTAPKVVSPAGRIVMSAAPTFHWSRVDMAAEYRLVITDDNGNHIFDGTTKQNSLTLSRPLERGEVYTWQVGVRFGEADSWANSLPARFKVLSAEDYAAIQETRRQMPGSHLALGALYESLGLYDEAANEFRILRRANPKSELAAKLLHEAVQAGRQ